VAISAMSKLKKESNTFDDMVCIVNESECDKFDKLEAWNKI
jgi:hypothetical protein